MVYETDTWTIYQLNIYQLNTAPGGQSQGRECPSLSLSWGMSVLEGTKGLRRRSIHLFPAVVVAPLVSRMRPPGMSLRLLRAVVVVVAVVRRMLYRSTRLAPLAVGTAVRGPRVTSHGL